MFADIAQPDAADRRDFVGDEAQVHRPFKAASSQRQYFGSLPATFPRGDGTNGGCPEAGQITAVHNRQGSPRFGVVVDLHAGDIGQVALVVPGKPGDPLQSASPQ